MEMKQITKEDVELVLALLRRWKDETYDFVDELSSYDSYIAYGQCLSFVQAISLIETVLLEKK